MSELNPNTPEVGPSTNETTPVPQIRFVPHITTYSRSLHFDVLDREVPPGRILKVGRYTDKVQPSQTRIAFKSKVVSRSHAEIWTENGQFFLRDIKSSSGTFLNQQRLSPPNQESAPHPLKDGDILQLGVDYQGGTQDVFRCVKIRLEINRSWQREDQNPFRLKALQTLEALKKSLKVDGTADNSTELDECCICLCSIAAFQALFVAPCSHTFHFKCIRRLLLEGPSFVCPLCRTYADLEADVCIEEVEKLVASTENLSIQPSQPLEIEPISQDEEHEPAAVPASHAVSQPVVNEASPSSPALGVVTPEEEIPSTDGGAIFPSEHQECRTPANPTPHLLFTGSARSMPTSRSLSVALPGSEDTGSTPASLLSPVGEMRPRFF